MNADRLFALYDRVADAPDAVSHLRRFVLDLAVRGKLVEQDPEDEPASELLERIDEAKDRLVRLNRAKESGAPPPIDPRDIPFELPSIWEWVYFGNIVDFSAGRTPPRKETSLWNTGDFPWVSIADMEDGKTIRSTKETVSAEARINVFKREPEPPGTMIMSFKLTIGKIAKLGIPAFHNEAIISIRPHVGELDSFLFKVLPDLARGGNTKKAIKGATLNRKSLSMIMVPLPPLREQHRIVAKVDELIALCNRMEEARTAREDTRDRLTKASLTRLSAADVDVPTFRSHARFAVDALPALTARADQVKHLRQTILSLAVRGNLVEQDPTDEPASELLNRIAAEKVRLVKAGEIRNPKRIPVIDTNELPFGPPHGWAWTRLLEISRKIHYGFTASANRMIEAVRLLRITDIQDNRVDWFSVPGCEIGENILPKFKLERGDVLIARTGGTIGKSFLVQDVPVTAVFASYLIRIQGSHEVYDRYLKLFLESPAYWTQLRDGARGAGQPNVNGQILGKIIVSLPPLAEQHRIVAKVDELMALCDRLETGLATAADTHDRLLESLLHGAFATYEAVTPRSAGR